MKLMFISLLFLPIILMADGPMGENVKGRYGGEEIFTEKGQSPMPAKGYDREKCMQANARFRTLINRIRTITFRIERKCSKGAGNVHKAECSHHVAYLEEIYSIFNRQFEVMSKVCLAE
jgi:hypothetical protein